MAACVFCKHDNKDGAKFCSACGKQQPAGTTFTRPTPAIQPRPVVTPQPIKAQPPKPELVSVPTQQPTIQNGNKQTATATAVPRPATPKPTTQKSTSIKKGGVKEYAGAIKDNKLPIPKKIRDALGITGDAPITFIVNAAKEVSIKIGKIEDEE